MAAVSALATGLGAFLAPQLPRALGVLLDARALAPGPHGMAASAARARETLTATVPPRLLLPPLYAHLPAALQVPGLTLLTASIGQLTRLVHGLCTDTWRCFTLCSPQVHALPTSLSTGSVPELAHHQP